MTSSSHVHILENYFLKRTVKKEETKDKWNKLTHTNMPVSMPCNTTWKDRKWKNLQKLIWKLAWQCILQKFLNCSLVATFLKHWKLLPEVDLSKVAKLNQFSIFCLFSSKFSMRFFFQKVCVSSTITRQSLRF